jgi:hypothetical protein
MADDCWLIDELDITEAMDDIGRRCINLYARVYFLEEV